MPAVVVDKKRDKTCDTEGQRQNGQPDNPVTCESLLIPCKKKNHENK